MAIIDKLASSTVRFGTILLGPYRYLRPKRRYPIGAFSLLQSYPLEVEVTEKLHLMESALRYIQRCVAACGLGILCCSVLVSAFASSLLLFLSLACVFSSALISFLRLCFLLH